MPLVPWKSMTAAQRVEAIGLRPRWHLSDFPNFEFWIKADGHVSRRGGHHSISEAAHREFMKKFEGIRQHPDEPSAFRGETFHFAPERK